MNVWGKAKRDIEKIRKLTNITESNSYFPLRKETLVTIPNTERSPLSPLGKVYNRLNIKSHTSKKNSHL